MLQAGIEYASCIGSAKVCRQHHHVFELPFAVTVANLKHIVMMPYQCKYQNILNLP